jgi:hypothetical protein
VFYRAINQEFVADRLRTAAAEGIDTAQRPLTAG